MIVPFLAKEEKSPKKGVKEVLLVVHKGENNPLCED